MTAGGPAIPDRFAGQALQFVCRSCALRYECQVVGFKQHTWMSGSLSKFCLGDAKPAETAHIIVIRKHLYIWIERKAREVSQMLTLMVVN